MRVKPEFRVVLAFAVFITLLLNAIKLFSLQEGTVISQYMRFDILEFLFQFSFNLLCCLAMYFLYWSFPIFTEKLSNTIRSIIIHLLLVAVLVIAGGYLHLFLFEVNMPPSFFWLSYIIRLGLSQILIWLALFIWLKNQETQAKIIENNQLNSLFLQSQLQLMKQQLNPHFFFNTLSSLSAIIQENPSLAQGYVNHLSNVFRYSLQDSSGFVTLQSELKALESYFKLIGIRFEKGIMMKIMVEEEKLNYLLLHMSLQPLVENIVKHNQIDQKKPLLIVIKTMGETITVENDLIPLSYKEPSTQIGLSNLAERYKIQSGKEIFISKTATHFSVTLPLKP